MIQIIFSSNRKLIRFVIEDREVTYFDDMWREGLKILPSQTPEMRLMLRKMILSRKPAIKATAQLIVDANSGKNKEQYDACKTEEEIAEIIRTDCLVKGLVEIKNA